MEDTKAKETLLETQNKYLEALQETGSNKAAAEKVYIGPRTAYCWLKDNILNFSERYEMARWVIVNEVEWSLFSLALGDARCGPVELKAKEIVLKAYKPERYGDKVKLIGDAEKPIYVKSFLVKETEPYDSGS